jgi:gamma-glutamyltranspeptidase / glutathione hydrolase
MPLREVLRRRVTPQRRRPLRRRPALVLAALLAACAHTPPAPTSAPLPEGASGYQAKPLQQAARFMVSAGHPLATQAGVRVLRDGGSAVDAAVAVQMVLTLVEPQASGIGGGAFALHWDGREVQAWDGRETAPAAADERLFLQADGRPMPYAQAAVGGLAVGVPGALQMLEQAHRRHGRLPWAQLFDPAIEAAEQGFAVSPRLHALLASDPALKRDPLAARFFYGGDGAPHAVGQVLRNPALAQVLRAVAQQGTAAFYAGPVAQDIVTRVQGHAEQRGRLSLADLRQYRSLERVPICTDWRERYRVCGMPPPSSGHLATMQILGMLQLKADLPPALVDGVPGAAWLHVYTEAARLAFADRAQYVADPAFTAAPGGDWRSLLQPPYLAQRAALIGPRAMDEARPGLPAPLHATLAPQAAQPESGTSQISIVDARGHAFSMTTSIQTAWGSRILSDGGTGLAGGFLLNNQLTDFAFAPRDAAGHPVANRVQPGKRPRSSMSPTLVFERADGRLRLVAGSTLGPMIIHSLAKALSGTLAWGLDVQQAVELPNFGPVEHTLLLEQGRFPETTVETLRALGHRVAQAELATGLQLIGRDGTHWVGGADPRKEGTAAGD